MNRYLTSDGYLTIKALLKLNRFAKRAYSHYYQFVDKDKQMTTYAIEWCSINKIDRFNLWNKIMLQSNDLTG